MQIQIIHRVQSSKLRWCNTCSVPTVFKRCWHQIQSEYKYIYIIRINFCHHVLHLDKGCEKIGKTLNSVTISTACWFFWNYYWRQYGGSFKIIETVHFFSFVINETKISTKLTICSIAPYYVFFWLQRFNDPYLRKVNHKISKLLFYTPGCVLIIQKLHNR